MSLRSVRVAGIALSLCVLIPAIAVAQEASIALPYTMSTVAGTSPMAATAGTPCPTLNARTGAVSTDAFGDGCLAVNGIFGAAARGGVQVDAFGNVFVADDVDSIIHVINPITGVMTVLAGGASSVCAEASGVGASGAVDSAGDGCLAATQTKASGQRGIGIDPYGNVLLSGYSDNTVHLVCRTASPLCSVAQIGMMRLVAGCVKNAGSNGTSGVGADNVQAAQTFVSAGCAAANGEVDSPRGVTADIYGNVYFADTSSSRTRVVVGPLTSSYFTGNNPIYAALGVYYASVTQGFAYSVVNTMGTSTSTGGTATVGGNSCSNTVNSVTYSGTALDTLGDGCPLNFSSVSASSGYTSGVAVDAAGDMVFTDPAHGLRVFYVGGTSAAAAEMQAAIVANNPGVTPQAGFIYLLWGGGATTLGAAPTLGTSTKATDTTIVKLAVTPQGNIFIGDSSKVVFYDLNTGYVRLLFTGTANVTAGNFCAGTSGQKSLSAYSDGCVAADSVFSNSNGLGVAADAQGNLYLFDASSNTSGMLVRKVLAQGLASQTLGTLLIQNFQLHFDEAAAGSVSTPTATLTTTSDMTAGTLSCGAQNHDNSFDCDVAVTATPSASGLRSATLTVSLPFTPSGGAETTSVGNIALDGTVLGSALAFDSATSTNGTTTHIAPTMNPFFSGITPAGVALDGAGNVYAMDTHNGQFLEYLQGAGGVALAGTLPTSPSQIAVDQLGDVFAVGSGTPSITELAVSGPPASTGEPSAYTNTTVSYTPISGTASPQAIAVDDAGNLFVADKQSTTADTAIYRVSLAPNAPAPQVTVATGFTDPLSLAVDIYGNVYVADKGAEAVYKLTPGLVSGVPGYVQSTVALSGVMPVAVAVDAAGDLYVQDANSLSVIEVPVSGANTTVLSGLVTPTGLAVDGVGDVYSADSSKTSITQVVRDGVSFSFGSSISTTLAGTLTDVGTESIAGSNTATDTTDFAVAGGSGDPCDFSASVLGAQAAGNACTLSATFTPQTGTGTVSDVLSYLPASSSIGSLTMTAIKTGVAPIATTTTIGGETPTNPVYVASGPTVTFTVTVAATSGTASGTVDVTVDSGTATPYTLNGSGMAAVVLSGIAAGPHTISASYAAQSGFAGSNSTTTDFSVAPMIMSAPPVATGDSRTVTEPSFPAVCQTLTADLTSVNDDIPTSVDATITNPDGARIQAALNACASTNQAVRLSIDGAGHDAYLTGPLNMPSGVTLLVDPGVFVYFSRNVQDYDVVPGTHTCGTVNSNSATSSCLPLINITGVSNVGIMGFGKLDGRGGDTLINAFPSSFAGQSWWGLSAIANSGGNQQNPRFIQVGSSTNITLYKITLRNSPLFHVSTNGGVVNGLTAWDIKIVTPTSARNTDGVDPDQAQNFTITRSWISDGDDNVAVGASGGPSSASVNISVTNNHFFAGHGESIGSFTSAGVSNILFDGNMLAGNSSVDSNSTGIRIKSANDRGGVVQDIQYSNSCFENHATEVQFTPIYNTNTGTLTPNFKSILMQNLYFLTAGTVEFTGADNNGVINPLILTMDNVDFATLPPSDLTPAPSETQLTLGPGDVSTNLVTDYEAFVGSNGNSLTDNRTTTSLFPPSCSFTYIAPELTGPAGLPQTITFGDTATAVVILTPAVGGSAYPTGTVTLSDGAGSTTTVTLPGTGDTISIPLSGLSVGTHTFTATYSGDANYVPTVSGTPYSTTEPYVITVNAGSLVPSTTTLSGVPATTTFGTAFTATATVTGSTPTGVVEFVVNGVVSTTAAVSSGSAQATFNLPLGTYTISAIYSGDTVNAGSTSASSALGVTPALTSTALVASTMTTSLGVPVTLTATVSSAAGTPTGTVSFTYTSVSNPTPTSLASATLTNGVAIASVDLPIGADSVTATYTASGSFAGSISTPAITITVNPPVLIASPSAPIALPYTMSTIAGGSTAANANTACAGSTDTFGDGCQATSIIFNGSVDLRSVAADPFGNVYLTDANASLVRRIAPNGTISNFAGYVAGTACLPSATAGCTPSLVKLNKPRGVSTDPHGNIYIAGYNDNKVYEYSVSTGLLYLVAGNGTKPSSPTASNGDGGAATAAMLNGPRGVWADSVGNIYIADTTDNKIRVVNSTGTIQTFAGTGTTSSSGDGGLATAATIDNPQGVLTDANDNVYIADSQKVRVVCVTCEAGSGLYQLLTKVGVATPQNGFIYTLAGGGSAAYSGPALANTISMSPQKLAMDSSGNLYISDGNGAAWFVDSRTAYIRLIAGDTTTNCASATDGFGDACPATQAIIGDGGNGIGVGMDSLGNIYVSDTLNARIRKVSTNLHSPATATSATATLPIEIHFIAGDGPAASNAFAYASSEWQLGTPSCTTNLDTTVDCLINSSFTPAVPGARSTPLTVNSSGGNTAYLALSGTGLGAGATLDPATQTNFGANLQVLGIATDNSGNVYAADAKSKSLLRFSAAAVSLGAGATSTTLATVTAPSAVAVDARGYAYIADSSTGLITQISPGGTVMALPFKFTSPAGLAVDALNNLYVSDPAAQAVYQLSPTTGAQRALAIGALVAPAGIAIDPSGNLLVTDPGAPAIYRFNVSTGATTTISSPAVKSSAIAVDAAGNLLIADTASIDAVPASTNSAAFTVASVTPSGLGIDAAGNLYTGYAGGVLKLTRTQGSVQFASASAAPQTASLLESGNQGLLVSSVSQTDATDYSLTATASTDCTLNGSLPSTVAVGGVCTLTATFTPTTFANPTDTATFNGNLSNAALSTPSSVQLTLTGPAVAPTPTIALGAFSPAAPIVGQTVMVSATVTGSDGVIPAGSVVFTVDASTMTINLTGGVATATLTGLTAGTHTISAAYTSANGYASASTAPVMLTVSNPAPTLTMLSQTSATGGTASFTLTVTGTNFVTTSAVQWNGVALATTFVSSTQLTATVPASDISTGGTPKVTVFNPAPGGGTSTGLTFTIIDYSMSSATGPQTIVAGASAVFSITTAPVSGAFANPVTFTVSGLPTGAGATFNPTSVTPGASTTLTITTTSRVETAGTQPRPFYPHGPGAPTSLPLWSMLFALALLLAGTGLAGFTRTPIRRLAPAAALILLVVAAAYIAGCASRPTTATNPNGTPAGLYTITVTGTSGDDVHTTTVTLDVE
jgi:polygalacturonase/sugar lactone lactonase YvrE